MKLMELIKFRDRIFGKIQSELYLLEPSWDSFRPITKLAWNNGFKIIDNEFKKDLFSDFYGFRSPEEKEFCRKLIDNEISPKEISDPVEFWKWCGEELTWWNDRYIVFDTCASRDIKSWKSYLKYMETKHKTLRRSIKKRMTRRLVPK